MLPSQVHTGVTDDVAGRRTYRCVLEFAPDDAEGRFVPPMYRTDDSRRAA